jgi:hypothetical protein
LGPSDRTRPLRLDAGDSRRRCKQCGKHEPRIPSHEVSLFKTWTIGSP